jgi:hypothetical protein
VISTLVIPTRNRQDQALCAVESFQKLAQRYDRELEVIVFDTTITPAEYPGCRVIRPVDINNLIDKLVARGFEREVLTYGLTESFGGSRNLGLLFTQGKHVLSTDDDTRAELRAPVWQNPKTIRFGNTVPTQCQWYASRDEWQSQDPADVDILAQHEFLLGGSSNDGYEFRITLTGVVGDSGADTNISLFLANGIEREQILSRYNVLRNTREFMQASSDWYLTRVPSARTFNFSYDNTSLLPPFLCAGRGEGEVFARILMQLEPKTCIGHIPWAVTHIPPQGRRYIDDITTPDFSSLIIYAIEQSDGKSLNDIGSALISVGNTSLSELRISIDGFCYGMQQLMIKGFESTLARYDEQPEEWANDVKNHIVKLQNPTPIQDTFLTQFKNVAKLHGKLLQCWPTLSETFQNLNIY